MRTVGRSGCQAWIAERRRHFRRRQLRAETATARADRRPIASCSCHPKRPIPMRATRGGSRGDIQTARASRAQQIQYYYTLPPLFAPDPAELEWIGMITVPLPPAQQHLALSSKMSTKFPSFWFRRAGIATPIESGCRLELGIWLCCCRRSGAVKACTIPPSFSSPNRRAPAVPSSRLASSSSSTTISTNAHPPAPTAQAGWLPTCRCNPSTS